VITYSTNSCSSEQKQNYPIKIRIWWLSVYLNAIFGYISELIISIVIDQRCYKI